MLSVRAETLGEVTVLHLRGRITIGNATETLSEVVRAETAACALVLDLAEVDLIDARGLGMLVELRQWTQSRGIEFRLMNVSRLVQQVISITRLDTVLQIYRQRTSSPQWQHRDARTSASHSSRRARRSELITEVMRAKGENDENQKEPLKPRLRATKRKFGYERKRP